MLASGCHLSPALEPVIFDMFKKEAAQAVACAASQMHSID